MSATLLLLQINADCLPLSVLPRLALELKAITGYYRRHLLQFGTSDLAVNAANLSLDGTMGTLAWIIRHFVPLIVEQPKFFWESLLSGRPLNQYMTTTDLAFTILVLEHHMMQWHRLVLFQLETGKIPSAQCIDHTDGLLYKGGIAGREAKQRFDNLNVYLYRNFCTNDCPQRQSNLSRLQRKVAELVRKDSDIIKRVVRNHGASSPPPATLKAIQEDILHCVFYYMHY